MRIHSIMMFAGGLLIGGVSGFFGAKKMYQKKYSDYADQQIREMEEYYGVKDEYQRGTADQEMKDYEKYPKGDTKDEREAMREIRKQTKKEHTDYKGYYQAKMESDEALADGTDPADEESPEEEIENEHLTHRNDPPELISETAVGDVPAWVEEESLFYDVEKDLLTDEDDNPIMDREMLVGNVLDDYMKDLDYLDYAVGINIWNHSQDVLYNIQFI